MAEAKAKAEVDGEPRAKRHRVDKAPDKWANLPAENLTFCIGSRDASTAVDLINVAARCPALTAYDLRWRRHAGQQPRATAPDTSVRRKLLSNTNDPPELVWPGLRIELTEKQRKSLRWMRAKEAGTDDELVVERGCQDCRFSTHRGIDFQVRLAFTLRGGILADAMGYGKTLLAIALTLASYTEPLEGHNDRPPCGVTLILVPENLVCQWLGEFQKMLGSAVETVFCAGGASKSSAAVGGVAQRGAFPKSDAAATAEMGSGGVPEGVLRVYAAATVEGWRELMEEQWPEALAIVLPYSLLRTVEPWFCLHRYRWRRVVVDELHEALACQTLADALSLISAQHVWGLSGTLPTSTTGDVAGIAALFGVSIPIDETNAGRFLDCYVRRNTAEEAGNIPMDEHRQLVKPTPMERALYLACQHDFDQPIAVPEAHQRYIPAFLSTWRGLQEHGREAALVKLCCHHEATSTDIELLATPAQSVERLCVWKRHHCEEARSLIRRHVVLAEWMYRHTGQEGAQHLELNLPGTPPQGLCEQEARSCVLEEAEAARGLGEQELLAACGQDLEVMPFAVCDRPAEAEARWLEWCESTGLAPGTRGAISRLKKIMYDELWGRLLDGHEGWAALAKMPGRNWRSDYAAAQHSRLLETMADYASSLRSLRFLETVRREASTPGQLDCGICLQPMCQPHMTPCAHMFCLACIQCSLRIKPECPTCRAPVQGPLHLSSFYTSEVSEPQESIGGSNRQSSASSSSTGAAAASVSAKFPAAGEEFGSKISALVRHLKAIQNLGEKAVVFAQWQDLIFKIHTALVKFGVAAAVLFGGAFDRASVLQRFESAEVPVLLLSLEDSASGTNMAHANHVLLVHPMVAATPEEREAYESQAIGRVRRWGQRRRVQVWRFVMEGTVEAALEERQGQGRIPSQGQSGGPDEAELGN